MIPSMEILRSAKIQDIITIKGKACVVSSTGKYTQVCPHCIFYEERKNAQPFFPDTAFLDKMRDKVRGTGHNVQSVITGQCPYLSACVSATRPGGESVFFETEITEETNLPIKNKNK